MVGSVISLCLTAFQLAGNYLCSFYLYLRVDMSKKQIVRHVMITYIWGIIMAYMTRICFLPIQYIFVVIWELGYLYITVYKYAEDNFYQNVFHIYFSAQVANTVAYGLFMLVKPQFLKEYLTFMNYLNVKYIDIILYAMTSILTFLLMRPLIMSLFRKMEHMNWFYKVFFVLLQVTSIQEALIRLYEPLGRIIEKHLIFRLLFWILLVVLTIYAMVRSRRVEIRKEQKRLGTITHALQHQYEEILAENEESHKLHHEWNRQVSMVKDLEQQASKEELSQYIEQLEARTNHIISAIRSGNLYMDTVLNKQREILEQQGIEVEMVVEPIHADKGLVRDVIMITEELFHYVSQCVKSAKWCQFSLRKKQGKLICYMDIGYSGGIEYHFFKFRDMIGNGMKVRQFLNLSRHITDVREGMIRYTLDRSNMEIAVMISVKDGNEEKE